jgi:hypothetical protein
MNARRCILVYGNFLKEIEEIILKVAHKRLNFILTKLNFVKLSGTLSAIATIRH